MSDKVVWRTEPYSSKRRNTSLIAARSDSSGLSTTEPSGLYSSPAGSTSRSSPLAALWRIPASRRPRKSWSSASEMVPLRPRTSRSE